MQAIRSILVVIDPSQPEGLALNRARLIASVTQSHLHLLACEKRGDHSLRLEAITKALEQEGFSASSQQAWRDNLSQTIVDVQQAKGCGLVIKEHKPDNPLKKALLTPDDWKLLRSCPAPVLLVKTDQPWAGRNILAAVDVGNNDAEHRTLHSSIVNSAHEVSVLVHGALHIITAHPSPMLSAADPTYQLSETIEAKYRLACGDFQQEYNVDDQHLHVEEGPADVLIPRAAHRLEAAVTVIGTVARSGLSGALIGNTAEVVMDALESDILVLKPEDVALHLEELAGQR